MKKSLRCACSFKTFINCLINHAPLKMLLSAFAVVVVGRRESGDTQDRSSAHVRAKILTTCLKNLLVNRKQNKIVKTNQNIPPLTHRSGWILRRLRSALVWPNLGLSSNFWSLILACYLFFKIPNSLLNELPFLFPLSQENLLHGAQRELFTFSSGLWQGRGLSVSPLSWLLFWTIID